MRRWVDLDKLLISINAVFDSKTAKKVCEYLNSYIAYKEEQTWIPVAERLPEEPKNPIDEEEGAYDLSNLTEYNVTIADAREATTLYYAGDDVWIDNCGNYYHVIAWMQLPERYKAD